MQPVGDQAERRQLAPARRAVFLDLRPTQPRVADRLQRAGEPHRRDLAHERVVEDWAKTCLACPVTTTQGTRVVERFDQAIKYQHLDRHQINDGLVLAREWRTT